MSNVQYPVLIGAGWPRKEPVNSTIIQGSISGQETRIANWQAPKFKWTIPYGYLNDDPSFNTADLQILIDFFNARHGAWDSFLYDDDKDDAATRAFIAVGDGITTIFPLLNNIGASVPDVNKKGVNYITVSSGGSGYTSAPSVTLVGGSGTGAKAVALLSGGSVSEIVVTSAGNGYTSAPSVVLNGGGGSGASGFASLTPAVYFNGSLTGGYTILQQAVTGVVIQNGGSGYTSAPTVSFVGGSGSGAVGTAVLGNGQVTSITITGPGTGYTSAPTITFTGGGGSGAAATAVVAGGVVTSITITNPGSGYTSNPVVHLAGGGGSSAAASATVTYSVVGLNISNNGSNYTTLPAVTFTGGGGSGAAALGQITAGGIKFGAPPGAGITITASFAYFYRVRFQEDSMEFKNVVGSFWNAEVALYQTRN